MPRLDRLLAALGYGTRREVAQLCRAGRVSDTDGRLLKNLDLSVSADRVLFDSQPLDHPNGIFIALNKPTGFTCSHDSSEGPLVYDLLPARWRLRNPVVATVGRLDKETSGVLLVTDNGQWNHRLSSPKHHVEKTYIATTRDPIAASTADRFASGMLLLDGDAKPCLPARLTILEPHVAELVITEGRYHQVRRMFAACGNAVTQLHRRRFGPYTCDDLEPGRWRELPPPF